MRRAIDLAAAADLDLVHGPVTAAERALRAGAAVIHDEAGAGGAAAQFDLVVEPEAAPLPPRPARALAQRVAAVEHREGLLHDLDRRRLGDADGRAAVRQPVVIGVAAIAAARKLVHHEIPAPRRVVPAQREIAAGAGRRRRHPVGQRLDQRGEDRLGDALADLGRAARDRARIARIEEGAADAPDLERLEGAGADRHLREDMPHRQVDRAERRRPHRVHRAPAGRARAREVEAQPGARALDRQPDRKRLVDHAVAVDPGHGLVAALGNLGDEGAHLLGGAGAQLADRQHHRVVAISVEQRRQPGLAHHQRRRLRLDVADALVGHADVRADDGVDLRIQLAPLEEAHGRQAQPLLLDRRGGGREAAGHRAAGVGPVPGVGQPAPDPAVAIERPGEAHIHQVGAAQIGIVDDVDVAGRGLGGPALADHLDQRGGRILHGADEDRQAPGALRDQRAVLRRIDPVRAVVRLGDHRREGGAREGQVHLVADLLQAGLDDRQGDRVEAHGAPPTVMIRLPSASPVAWQPGSISTVLSICSISAGPSISAAAGSRSRR